MDGELPWTRYLWALPNHVRHLPCVRRWVRTKVMIYHLYRVLMTTKPAAQAA